MSSILQSISVSNQSSSNFIKGIKVGDVLDGEIYFSGFPSTGKSHSIQITEITDGKYRGFHISNGQTTWRVELVYNSTDENFNVFVIKSNGELRSLGIFSIFAKGKQPKLGSNISKRVDPNHQDIPQQIKFGDRDRGEFVNSNISDIPGVWELVDTTRVQTGAIIQHGGDSVPPHGEEISSSLVAEIRIGTILKGRLMNLEGRGMDITCTIQRLNRSGIVVAGLTESNQRSSSITEEYLLTDLRGISNDGFDSDMYINSTKIKIGTFRFTLSTDPILKQAFKSFLQLWKRR